MTPLTPVHLFSVYVKIDVDCTSIMSYKRFNEGDGGSEALATRAKGAWG